VKGEDEAIYRKKGLKLSLIQSARNSPCVSQVTLRRNRHKTHWDFLYLETRQAFLEEAGNRLYKTADLTALSPIQHDLF
jgi:hypothetical protein